jgi:hypothetical protein
MDGTRTFLVVAGLMAVVWSASRWRQAVQVALVLLILEGALRKWVFPGAQDIVYFAKDVFFLGAYAGFLRQRQLLRYRPMRLPLLHTALALSALFGLAEVFNPSLPNLLVGALGFKAYFFYAPLLFLVPAALPDDRALAQFLRRYVLISVPIGLLAVAQFFSPAGSAINTYARGVEDVSYVSTFGSSSFVRVTATFSYITGYTSYLLATAILLLAVLATVRWRFKRHLDLYLALGITFLSMLMTGSRGPVLLLALLFPLYWWLTVIREKQSGATFSRILLGLGLVAAFLAYAGPEAIDAFQGRAAATSEDTPSRMLVPFIAPVVKMSDAGLFGFGIGATHQTAATVARGIAPYSWLHGEIIEAETGRVMLELGPLGFLLVYSVRIFLAALALRQALSLRVPFHRAVATAAFLYFLAALPGSVVFDVTADVYFWFFAGLLLLVMRLDREAVLAARAARASSAPQVAGLSRPVPALPEGWQPHVVRAD